MALYPQIPHPCSAQVIQCNLHLSPDLRDELPPTPPNQVSPLGGQELQNWICKMFSLYLCSPTVFFLWEQNCCLSRAASSSSSSWSSLSWSRYLLQWLPSVLPSYNSGELLKTAKHGGSHFWYCYTCAKCLKSWISSAPVSRSQVQSPVVSVHTSLCLCRSLSDLIHHLSCLNHKKASLASLGFTQDRMVLYLPQLCRDLTCWTELSSSCAALFLLSFTESSTHLK